MRGQTRQGEKKRIWEGGKDAEGNIVNTSKKGALTCLKLANSIWEIRQSD